MSSTPPTGRRERNKAEKLARITAAAADLFAARGIDEVTTAEIAERADVGAGTVFLYARSKGDLLLLVQNALYEEALAAGREAAAEAPEGVDAVMALLAPIVRCNRTQVENGRTYLREMVFGDPAEPHHAAALAIVGRTDTALRELLAPHAHDEDDAAVRARLVSAAQFMVMASAPAGVPVGDLLARLREQVEAVLR